MSASKPEGVRPTHEWELLLPLLEWPAQERYEQIRPLVHFDASVAERAREWEPRRARFTEGSIASRRKGWSPSSTLRRLNAGGCRPQ